MSYFQLPERTFNFFRILQRFEATDFVYFTDGAAYGL